MKLRDIYERAVRKAIREDPRTRETIKKELKKTRDEFRKLKGIDRKTFDAERLKHPYDDSRILFGDGNADIKTVLLGIDIGVQEILLADRLREKGVMIDLVISHHPSGRALAQLDKVMHIQPRIWESFGLSREVADGLMKDRSEEVARGISANNHTRVSDAARLLGMPFMCMHTLADNCVASFLQKTFDREKPKRLIQVTDILKNIPEYRYGLSFGSGPHILIGDGKKEAGKVFVDMTGGTGGPDRVFPRLSQVGIKTIVGMHLKETSYKAAKSEFLNYIIAGHIASDALGVNLMLDAIDPSGKLNIIECSGFKRFKR